MSKFRLITQALFVTVSLAFIFLLVLKVQTPSQTNKAKAYSSTYQTNNWRELFLNWPITNPDAVEFLYMPNYGKIVQTLIKGDTYWWRMDMKTNIWLTGKLTSWQNTTPKPFPQPATFATFMDVIHSNGQRWQGITNGKYWWVHREGQPWIYTGELFAGQTTTCSTPLPTDRIDTDTQFLWNGKIGQTVTKNGFFWYMPDTATKRFTYCGYPIYNERPQKFDTHTAFLLNGKLAEVFTSGTTYWFFPDTSNRYLFYKGTINKEQGEIAPNLSSNIGSVNKNIFGANLLWNWPFNRFWNDAARTKLVSKMNELGVSIIRFPGGCLGDAYNYLDPTGFQNLPGQSVPETKKLLRDSRVDLLYTLNLEGEGHISTNGSCNALTDKTGNFVRILPEYPGRLNQVQDIINKFSDSSDNSGYSYNLKFIESGNEPWAWADYMWNWYETWTPSEYASKVSSLKTVLNQIPNGRNIKLIGATGNLSDWENSLINYIDGLQYHMYSFGNSTSDYPLAIYEKLKNTFSGSGGERALYPNKILSVNEYGLFCWNGSYKKNPDGSRGPENYSINKTVYKLGHSLNQTLSLFAFAEFGIDQAMVLGLFESSESSWKCGLIQEDAGGNYYLTSAGEAFKLMSSIGDKIRLSQTNSTLSLMSISVKNSNNKVTTVIINPTPNTVTLKYFLPANYMTNPMVKGIVPSRTCLANPDEPDVYWTCLKEDSLIIPPRKVILTSSGVGSLEVPGFSLWLIYINLIKNQLPASIERGLIVFPFS